MRPLSKRHAAIMDALIQGMGDDNPHRRIDNAPGAFMAVVVERIGPERWSIAHYYEQNGDLVPDPDLEMVRQDGDWFPVAITHWGRYRCTAETNEHGRIVSWNRAAYRDLRSFAGTLLTNIKAQQGELAPRASEDPISA